MEHPTPGRTGLGVSRTVDDETRCVHWHGPLDVVAIRFRCCGEYYPCFSCHAETATHAADRWPVTEHDARAVLCGVCRHELTVTEYLGATGCPSCGAAFNPGCRTHAHLYFELSPAARRARPARPAGGTGSG